MISLQQLKKDLKNPFNLNNIIIALYCSIVKLKDSISKEEINIISSDNSISVEETDNTFDITLNDIPDSHDPVTLGTPNGLTLDIQELSLDLAASDSTGALSFVDWNIFNNKQNALGFTPENVANKGVPDGYTPLDGNNKVPLIHINDALLGNVKWKGLYNGITISSSPDPALNGLPLPVASIDNVGWYFIADGNFTYGSVDYALGDWIISNGVIWAIVDNTDNVSSVFGRTGHIIAVNGDYNTGLVTEVVDKRYQTDNQKLFNDATSSIQTQLNSKVTNSRTLNINGVAQDLSANREWRTAQADTGVLTFAGLTVNSTTTINIGAVKGYVINNETNPLAPTHTFIDYLGETNKTVTTLAGTESFVMLGVGGVISFQNSFPTSAERKTKIWLGKVSHPAGTITLVVNEPDYITSPLSLTRDLYQKFSYVNENVYPYANGANLSFNLTGGLIGGNGINFVTDKTNPNNLTVAPAVISPFLYRTRTGGATGAVTVIDPTRYDVAGTPTLIGGGANNSTIQYFYLVPGQGLIVQYGQTIYASLTAAIAAVGKESLVVYPNLVKNSILIGVLVVNRLAGQLDNPAQAQFFKADMFGQIIGATAGTTVGTLQTAYNNSPVPQIVVTDTLGAVTVKNNRALDSSTIQEWQNKAGATKASIDGDGNIIAVKATFTDNVIVPDVVVGTVDNRAANTKFVNNGFFRDYKNITSNPDEFLESFHSKIGEIPENPFGGGIGASGFSSMGDIGTGWQLFGAGTGKFNLKGRIYDSEVFGDWEDILTETSVIRYTNYAVPNTVNFAIRTLIESLPPATYYNRIRVFIPNGTYFELDIKTKDYVDIIGQSKEGVIINLDGTSTVIAPPDLSLGTGGVPINTLSINYKHIFWAAKTCTVANMTLNVNDSKYAIHQDDLGDYESIFNNITINQGTNIIRAIGIGSGPNQKQIYSNCLFNNISNNWAVGWHNRSNQSGGSSLHLENCISSFGLLIAEELGSLNDDLLTLTNCRSINMSESQIVMAVSSGFDPVATPYNINIILDNSYLTVYQSTRPFYKIFNGNIPVPIMSTGGLGYVVTSATYTPSAIDVTNTGSLVVNNAKYTRIGNTITVNVGLYFYAIAAGVSSFTITLPVNRALTALKNIGSGAVLNPSNVAVAALVQSDTVNLATIILSTTVLGNHMCSVTFQYDITE